MDNQITAVLAVWNKMELTVTFLEDILKRFPEIPIVVSALGNTQEYQDELVTRYGQNKNITLVLGSAGKRVAFSENWDAGINAVKTKKFVFLHNDMYLHQDFFDQLDREMESLGPDYFYLYTTIEPLKCAGFVRPGKVVAPFGEDFSDFRVNEFNEFASNYMVAHQNDKINGYGFYLAGYLESLQKVGGFDYHTFNPLFCEDDDLTLRIRLAGYYIRVVSGALVYHFGSKTIRDETDRSMSAGEVESNRKFARKWGFEARYLWETGYENMPNDLFSIGTEKIMYTYSGTFSNTGYVATPLDLENTEPLVDFLHVDDKVGELVKQHFKKQGLEHRFVPENQEADIYIVQDGPVGFNEFANLIGALRFGHRKLKAGSHARIGNLEIDIAYTYPECRVDPVNYLLEQKNKQYE